LKAQGISIQKMIFLKSREKFFFCCFFGIARIKSFSFLLNLSLFQNLVSAWQKGNSSLENQIGRKRNVVWENSSVADRKWNFPVIFFWKYFQTFRHSLKFFRLPYKFVCSFFLIIEYLNNLIIFFIYSPKRISWFSDDSLKISAMLEGFMGNQQHWKRIFEHLTWKFFWKKK